MTHVGIERFTTSDNEEQRTHRQEPFASVLGEVPDPVDWVHCLKHTRDLHHADNTQRCNHDEPHHHYRAEHPANDACAETLNGEQSNQYHHRQRDHHGGESRSDKGNSLDSRQHTDGWRDHAIAKQQRRAEEAQRRQHAHS